MSWNNNGYGYNSGYNNNYGNNYNRPKKRSGAKETIIRGGKSDGLISVHAWNYQRGRGLINAKAFQNRKSKTGTSRSGEWVALIFEVTFKKTGQVMTIPAVYNETTGKAYLEGLDMVISTKKNYFGKARR